MAKFERRSGEQIIGEFDISLVNGAKSQRARLVMTNERVVVLSGGRSRRRGAFFFGTLWFALESLLDRTESRIAYEIPRERFASVEADGDLTVFHDDGDGYGHTSFAIVRDLLVNSDSPDVWKQRMQSVWPTK